MLRVLDWVINLNPIAPIVQTAHVCPERAGSFPWEVSRPGPSRFLPKVEACRLVPVPRRPLTNELLIRVPVPG